MPELVELVGPDRLLTGMLEVPGDIGQRAAEKADPRPGEGDLGGRRKHVRPVRITCCGGQTQYVNLAGKFQCQSVHRIRVIPEQTEIRCSGAHLDQPTGHFPGVDRTRGVGEQRNRPHPLDRRIRRHQLLNQIDIGAVVTHRHGDHLDSQTFGDREMTVVARRRTEELDRGAGELLLDPGPRRVHATVQHREHHEVMHQLKAGIVGGDQVGHRNSEQFTEHGAQAGQTVQATVVAGVGALVVPVVPATR